MEVLLEELLSDGGACIHLQSGRKPVLGLSAWTNGGGLLHRRFINFRPALQTTRLLLGRGTDHLLGSVDLLILRSFMDNEDGVLPIAWTISP